MAGVAGSQPSNLPKPAGDNPFDDYLDKQVAAAPPAAPAASDVPPPTTDQPQVDQAGAPQGAPQFANGPQQTDPWADYLAKAAGYKAAGIKPEDVDENPSVSKQLDQFGNSVGYGFATTDKEKKEFLDNTYGEANVHKVKIKGKETFLVKGPDGFYTEPGKGVIGTMGTLTRPVLEGVATEGATALGAGAGALETLGTGGAGALAAVPTIAAARAGGAALGASLADGIQQSVYGIHVDPARNLTQEYLTASATNAVLGKLGDFFKARSVANAAAKESSAVVPVEQNLNREVANAVSGEELLKKTLGLQNAPGTNVASTPMQKVGAGVNPYAQISEQAAASTPEGQKKLASIFNNQATEIDRMTNTFLDSIKKTASEGSVKSGSEILTPAVVAGKMQDAEGAMIGEFRDLSKQAAGKGALPMPEIQKTLSDVSEKLGFSIDKNSQQVRFPTLESAIENGIVSPETTGANYRRYISSPDGNSVVQNLQKALVEGDGKLGYEQMDMFRKQLLKANDVLYKSKTDAGSDMHRMIGSLYGSIREAEDRTMGVLLKDNYGQDVVDRFGKNMQRYGELKDAGKTISGLLDKESMSARAVGMKLLNSDVANTEQINAYKTMLHDAPGVWDNVKDEFLRGMKAKYTNVDKVFDSSKFFNRINQLDPAVRDDLFPTQLNKDVFQALGQFSERAKLGNKSFSSPAGLGMLRKLSLLVPKVWIGAKLGVAAEIMSDSGKGQALARFIENGGQADILRGIPAKDRPRAAAFLKSIVENSLKHTVTSDATAAKAGQAVVNGVQTVGRGVSELGTGTAEQILRNNAATAGENPQQVPVEQEVSQ